MPASIVPYASLKERPKVLEELREIFFESSTRKDFTDDEEREAFYQKYLGFYLQEYPDWAWVGMGDEVLGYVVVSPESRSEKLLKLQPHLKFFSKECENFPAHLHVNCHARARGMGLGTRLIATAVKALRDQNIRGLHIMTGPVSPNRAFYKKLGFNHEHEAHGILFMGKRL